MKILYRKNGIVLLFILLLSFRATAQSDNNQIGIELYKLVSGNYDLYDLVYCYMVRGGNAGIDNNDLPKLNQFNENVAVQRNAQDFGIETRGLVNCTDTVQLRIYRMNVASYRFVIDMIQYPAAPGLTPVLQDIFLNTERPLKFGDTTRINFSVTSNAASTGLRFRIVFRRTQVQTAPFTQIPPICRGEAINLPTTSSNGVKGTWTPAVNNTQTTTYTFIPSEGQCATRPTMTVQVNQPALPTFTQVAAVCKGTAFTLPTTSNNGITGSWLPDINTNTTTTYTFTPAAGQCASTTAMTVEVNESTTPAFTQVAAICKGTSFTLPTTSNNGITGNWLPAINTNTTTTYTFTPAAGQCASTTTMTVEVNEPTSPAFTQVAAVCKGAVFTLPTTSNNGITGNWSPAINANTTTTYTFTPTAGQCASTATMTVQVNEPVTPVFNQIGPFNNGESFTLPTVSNNGISGNWSPAINNTTTTTYTFTPLAGQCATVVQLTVVINTATSLYDVTFDRSVSIYPNPVSENGAIQLLFKNQKAGKYELQFFAIDGTLVKKSMFIHAGGTSSRSINIKQNIGSGQYLVRIVNEMGEMETIKLMVK
jgi:hypothetical protein